MRIPLVLVFLGAACGPSQPDAAGPSDLADFECNDRRAEYMVVGGFVAPEAGVIVRCDGNNPRLTKWRLDGDDRIESTHRLSGAQFDTLWKKIDSTGWRHLEDECNNPAAVDGDPVYTIDIGDHAVDKALLCPGKELPFPYDRLVNELDLRAAGFGDEDDSPG